MTTAEFMTTQGFREVRGSTHERPDFWNDKIKVAWHQASWTHQTYIQGQIEQTQVLGNDGFIGQWDCDRIVSSLTCQLEELKGGVV